MNLIETALKVMHSANRESLADLNYAQGFAEAMLLCLRDEKPATPEVKVTAEPGIKLDPPPVIIDRHNPDIRVTQINSNCYRVYVKGKAGTLGHASTESEAYKIGQRYLRKQAS